MKRRLKRCRAEGAVWERYRRGLLAIGVSRPDFSVNDRRVSARASRVCNEIYRMVALKINGVAVPATDLTIERKVGMSPILGMPYGSRRKENIVDLTIMGMQPKWAKADEAPFQANNIVHGGDPTDEMDVAR